MWKLGCFDFKDVLVSGTITMYFKTKTGTKYGPLFEILVKQPAAGRNETARPRNTFNASGCVEKDDLINLDQVSTEPLNSSVRAARSEVQSVLARIT